MDTSRDFISRAKVCLLLVAITFTLFVAVFYVVYAPKISILWAKYEVDKYIQMVHAASEVERGLVLYERCKKTKSELRVPLSELSCWQYARELNISLSSIDLNFKLDKPTKQKINQIINRKNQDTIDSEAKILTEQLLNVLYSMLEKEKERLNF